MRNSLLAAAFAALLLACSPVRAQFCPGVSPWVFDDVAASDPFCGYITWMAQNGITGGCQILDANNRLYCPNDNVTRTQIAAFMNRLGNVRVEAVGTGPGLTGGPITGIGTINLAPTQLLPTTACASGQMPVWNGTAWACGSPSGGTVTSVTTGTGLTGGPITGSGTISADTSYLQRRVSQGCTVGSAITAIAADGTVTCAAVGAGTVTSVATGNGLTGGPITSSGTVGIATGGVGTAELANGAVTDVKRALPNYGAASAQIANPLGFDYAFVGPVVTLTLTASRPVMINGSAALGSTASGGADGLILYPCYQSTTSGPITTIGSGMVGLTVPQNQRHTFAVTGVADALSPGSYRFGICAAANSPTWNMNDYAYVNAVVL